jgi:Ca-activated chloride channel family protein
VPGFYRPFAIRGAQLRYNEWPAREVRAAEWRAPAMVEAKHDESTINPSRKSSRWTQSRLGLAALALLAAGTVSLGVVQARSEEAASQRAVAPRATGPYGVAGPITSPLGKPAPQLLAPAPAHWSRSDGSAVGFAATLDRGAVVTGGDGLVRIELVMKADEVAEQSRVDSDFVVVLDRSGSMGGGRIEQARSAIQTLLGQLSPRDRFALVTYDHTVEVAIPLAFASEGQLRGWQSIVAEIEPRGSTNISGGLDEGLALLQGARQPGRAGRMMLLSDGHANAGDVSPEGLRARGKRATESELVLSTVGIGSGFNEFLMTQVADAGTGNFHYLNGQADLAGIFARELESTRATVASGLSVRFVGNSGISLTDAAGYPLETGADGTRFQVGSLFSGQERRVWVTLRVPVEQEQELNLGRLELSYVEGGTAKRLAFERPLAIKCVKDEQVALAAIDKSVWERGVAQEQWGRVQQEVARAVHDGQRELAVTRLRDYRSQLSPLNSVVGSAAVSGTVSESEALERQVADAFEGADQSGKQNAFSKQNLALGRGKRRVGSVASAPVY